MEVTTERETALRALGLPAAARAHWNLSPPALVEESIRRGLAHLAAGRRPARGHHALHRPLP